MRACVVHNTLNSVGGGERVCLAIIEALKELGYEVTLLTVEPTEWSTVEKMMDVKRIVRPDKEENIFPFKVRLFGIYMRLLTFLKLLQKSKWDLVVNTHGDVLPISSDIIYMHYPTFALLREVPVNIKYSKSLFWRLYFAPYEKIEGALSKRLRYKILLTNSEYSAKVIRKYIGADAKVIYPPVNVEDFLRISSKTDREDTVILCGRFSPEKNYELALEIAQELPGVKFKIIGASSGKISEAYYNKLRSLIKERELTNVFLLSNVSRAAQLSLYSKAKVFLHTMIGEHFGIAIVEAMAAGLIPVVHKSGGPWNDITLRGKFGFGFSSKSEAVNMIEEALSRYNRMRKSVIKRANRFSQKEFKEKFKTVVGQLHP